MKSHYELLIIGAGPAGMAAACEAAHYGVDVALIDEAQAPGGQIYRNVKHTSSRLSNVLGKDYTYGKQLVERMQSSAVNYFNNTAVWYLDENLQTGVLVDGNSHFIGSDRLILATGAQERPMPIPGWQIPGVMTAGAGQILLKSAAMVPDGKLVLAGSGPLLLLLAHQYLQAGVKIEAIIDTTPKVALSGLAGKLIQALPATEYLIKGMSLIMAIKKAGVPVYKQASRLIAEGNEYLQSVSFQQANGMQQKIEACTLLLHQGVIPDIRLPLAAGCDVEWDGLQKCWVVKTNEWGQSSVDGVFVGGDSGGIVGARAAELQGQLCGLKAANLSGRLSDDETAEKVKKLNKLIQRHTSIRPLLDTLYSPASEYLLPEDDTIVCRCEEVKSGQIREAARLGCAGPNQVKSFTRCGMGPCQGSQCGSTVSALIADELNASMDEVGYYRVRPPFKPITLGQLSEI